MKAKHKKQILGIVALILCSPILQVYATQVDDNAIAALTPLFESQRTQPESEYLTTRITDERRKVSGLIKEELNNTVIEPDPETVDETVNPVERTRSVINRLEELQREETIELDVLAAEEKRYYLTDVVPEEAVDLRTTESYGELLAERAVSEERIAVLKSLITQQKEKLSLLSKVQVRDQFSGLLQWGWYVLVILAIFFIERWIQHHLVVRIQDKTRRYSTTKLVGIVIYGGTILVLLGLLLVNYPGILTSFAIIGAGLAVAMQDLVKGLVGWGMIQHRKIFSMGDRISIGGYTGEVIDVGLLRFTLLHVEDFAGTEIKVFEHTGKTVSIPNADVVTMQVVNHSFTSNYLRYEMRVCITFESDREKAEAILCEIVHDVAGEFAEKEQKQRRQRTRRLFLAIDPVDLTIYKNIVANGFEFTLRFVAPIGQGRAVASEMSERVMSAFDKEKKVNLAHNTIRVIPTPGK